LIKDIGNGRFFQREITKYIHNFKAIKAVFKPYFIKRKNRPFIQT